MFDFLAKLLGYVMKGCYWLTNNYVLALLLFALAMQILMCPLGIKQQKNMVKQAALRPKEMAIRNKYRGRNDRVTMQKMQNEIMDLYKREGYSQFAGCLPLIVQMLSSSPFTE
jgi:YidC/Oxa1 family membrane protein insertase